MALASKPKTASARPDLEVSDVFRLHADELCAAYPVSLDQQRVIHAITACRTAELGGHREDCKSCGFERYAYNSCCNRHCPKCQTLAKQKWLEARKSELLPVPYFHVVFTLPHALNNLILQNNRALLCLLFHSVSQTLLKFGHGQFGGKTGFLSILHTWDQRLGAHYHLHVVVPAGALSNDGGRWIHASRTFLYPVRALGKVYRGKFISGMKKLWASLRQPFDAVPLKDLLRQLYGKPWNVYSKRPFGDPEAVLAYLGRYTHRVAISNHRIVDVSDGHVTFEYRDRRDGDAVKTQRLPGVAFMRRFLLHVLPVGFMRIRHYGFFANRFRKSSLQVIRAFLNVPPIEAVAEPKPLVERILAMTGLDVTRCPQCQAKPLQRTILPPIRRLKLAPRLQVCVAGGDSS